MPSEAASAFVLCNDGWSLYLINPGRKRESQLSVSNSRSSIMTLKRKQSPRRLEDIGKDKD
ncbi:hypothetical protein HZS_7111 [Henneguya salminicola]|nr:hypothetical protein HZS_7111 [Henneguya salminicola]